MVKLNCWVQHILKHKKEELTFVELGSHLCIEESFKVQDSDKPKGNNIVGPSVVNMVEHNNSNRYIDNKGRLPKSYSQVAKDLRWIDAMNKELKALEENKTWTLTLLPPNKKAVGYKWVYKIKFHSDGTMERYKARLVAQGFTRQEGIDYTETFAPVAKMVTVKTLLVVAIHKNWHITQLDINNAFLHGDLHEEVYISLPQGYIHTSTLLQPSYADTSLLTYKKGSDFLALLIYVDDILLTGNNITLIHHFKNQLDLTFSIKDLGNLNYYPGIEFLRNPNGLTMSQRKYALELIQSANVLNLKPCHIPVDPIVKLNDTDGEPLNNSLTYRAIIILSVEDKLLFLEQPIPAMPVPDEGQVCPPDVLNTYTTWVKASKEIVGLMLMTMDPDIQKNFEHLGAYDMLKELKTLYAQQADQTVREFHACKQEEGYMGKTVTELHAMLKLHEQTLPPKEVAPALHAIRAGRIQKNQKKKSHKAAKGNQGKGKEKMGYAPVPAPTFAPKPKNPPTPNVVNLYVGDGHRVAVEAIREFHLCLPSGLVLILHNCHYAPSITRRIILVSHLYKDGFVNRFENDNSVSVSRNNVIYFNAVPRDDIYEIVLSSSNTNDSSMYAISNKRAKLNLDSTLLWHCRLGHINKKRMEKLQHDGLLNSTNIKSLEKCVFSMSGKMARKPYSHQVERAKDLLGLIYTDVCGPFKIMSRQGAYYFVTFTDNFSRYGYVYLLKHKHEVFETFKVFQKEVENQLKKTIKSLHSDRGERRNRTLLDMVRSMMSQTTLPKSFWDYALETAARILNMVPTKKVEKTPYEVWHGQAPKLSYLKVWGCEALVKRDTLTKPDKLEPRSIKCIFIGYPKETMGYSFYYPPENKVLVARNAEFLENSLITQEASGSLEDLEIIQEEDTHPSIDTSLNHEEDDLEIDKPQSDIIPIRRSTRTRRPTDRMCLYIDAEEHELGDLGEPANYKAALLDPESDKWLNAMECGNAIHERQRSLGLS
ncbi:retrotransposon protein, putative, ty1-copia subclass [Tanacetum coccineum]